MMYHFNVNVAANELNCQLYIRSSDVFLGLPWNIMTGALFTRLLCTMCGFNPGELTICLGDYHIYGSHKAACEEMIGREINKDFPTMEINAKIETIDDLINLEYNSIKVMDYHPYDNIKADMVV